MVTAEIEPEIRPTVSVLCTKFTICPIDGELIYQFQLLSTELSAYWQKPYERGIVPLATVLSHVRRAFGVGSALFYKIAIPF